jgi:hypothetical protein
MPGTPWRARLAALGATTAILVAACGGAATPTPAPATPEPTVAPTEAPTAPPFEAMVYPESGEAPCGVDPYTGNFKKISAIDAKTVVFELCNPDVAFLSKIAFSSFAINDTAWIEAKIDPTAAENQAIVSEINGTGPYKLKEWKRGSELQRMIAVGVRALSPQYPSKASSTSSEPRFHSLSL